MSNSALIGSVCSNVEKRDLNGSQKLGVVVITFPPTSCVVGVSHMVSHPHLYPEDSFTWLPRSRVHKFVTPISITAGKE